MSIRRAGSRTGVQFLNRLERSVERAAQARAYTFAVVGLEMQRLRAVERRLGTLVATTALEARRLEQRMRPTDLVARIGDRRLVILLDHFAPWTEALRHLEEWDASIPPGRVPPVHINLSPAEFWHPNLATDLGRRAATANLAPSRIKLEIPEAAVARRTLAAKDILESMAQSGFELWLDHFGEGGTPLRHPHSLPFRHAKLAPEMAWGPNENDVRACPTLGSLLSLGHDLGWQVTVVVVETRDQALVLRDRPCDWAQGFFYHGLLEASQIAALMRQFSGKRGR